MNTTLNKFTSLTPFGYNVDGKVASNVQGYLGKGSNDKKVFSMDVKADYALDLGGLSLENVAGFQAFQTIQKDLQGSGSQFPGPGLQVLGALGSPGNPYSSYSEGIEAGCLAQTRIGFSDYLYTTVGIRQDANSAFGSDFSTITYPRVNVSYIPTTHIGQLGPVSAARLRYAWGRAGQQPHGQLGHFADLPAHLQLQ